MEEIEPNGLVAIVANHDEAERALHALSRYAVDLKEVSIIGQGEASPTDLAVPEASRSPAQRAKVAGFWAAWGGMLGLGLASGAVGIPLIGILIGAGQFASLLGFALAAAGVSGGTGALIGALVGLGIHESHARAYSDALHAGKYLIVVHTDDPVQLRDAETALLEIQPEHLESHGLNRDQVIAQV